MNGPWQIGDTVLGQVIAIKPYGAFVQLPAGEVGLIHISEVAQEYVRDINDYLVIGQEVAVKIIGRSKEGKYTLSLKQVTRREEESARYLVQVQEFRKALEEHREELQWETSWRRIMQERQQRLASSHASLLSWIKRARKAIAQMNQHREERQKFYSSLDL